MEVTAGQDDDAVEDTATLTHTASGGDYASVSKDLPVTVTDNDTPGFGAVESELAVTEGRGRLRNRNLGDKLTTQPRPTAVTCR